MNLAGLPLGLVLALVTFAIAALLKRGLHTGV